MLTGYLFLCVPQKKSFHVGHPMQLMILLSCTIFPQTGLFSATVAALLIGYYVLGLTQGAFFIFHLLTKPFPSHDQPPIHLDHMTNC